MQEFLDIVKNLINGQRLSRFKQCQAFQQHVQKDQDEEITFSKKIMQRHQSEQKNQQAIKFYRSISFNISQSQSNNNQLCLDQQQDQNQDSFKYYSFAKAKDQCENQMMQQDKPSLLSQTKNQEEEEICIQSIKDPEKLFSKFYVKQVCQQDKIWSKDEYYYEVDLLQSGIDLLKSPLEVNGLSLPDLRKVFRDFSRNQLLLSLYYGKIKNDYDNLQLICPEQKKILSKQFNVKYELIKKFLSSQKIEKILEEYLDQGYKNIIQYTSSQKMQPINQKSNEQ